MDSISVSKARAQNRKTGYAGENIACDFLVRCGYSIVKQNYYTAKGEVDIICEDEKYIVFVEVKTRFDTPSIIKYGRPALAVNSKKKEHLIFSAKDYLRKNNCGKKPRLDVIEVYLSECEDGFISANIKHYKNAFMVRQEKSRYNETF